MITSLSKDTSLSNAVAMTIESLSASQSRELRHFVDLFEPYCEWVEDWEPRGWQIKSSGSSVTLFAPPGDDWGGLCRRGAHPSNDVVAAGAGVSSVKFVDFDLEKLRIEISYHVIR